MQELLVECIRTRDKKLVSASLCPLAHRPDEITQTCNDQPCPPRWRTGPYSNCTKLCGGGVTVRLTLILSKIALVCEYFQ